MPNVKIAGLPEAGKTLTAVGLVYRLCLDGGYDPSEVTANLHLPELEPYGCTYLPNSQIKRYVREVYRERRGELRHRIILVDEADGVYSHLNSMVKAESEDLLGAWQDWKMLNFLIYTMHEGLGVNKMLRDITQVAVFPHYDHENDRIDLEILNAMTERDDLYAAIEPASYLWDKYHREEAIV